MRDDEIEIDLRELVHVLWRKMVIIVLTTVIFGAGAFGYTHYFVTPLYESTSIIYIFFQSTSISSVADFQLSDALTADYALLASTRTVVEEVIDTCNLDVEYEELLPCIEVVNPADTHALEITVTYPDSTEAMTIANELAAVVSEQVANLMVTDMPTTWETAIAAEEPCSPSLTKNTAIGLLLGLFLSCGTIILLFILDDTITDEDDVIKYLGKNVLATLPKEDKNKNKSKATTKTSRKQKDKVSETRTSRDRDRDRNSVRYSEKSVDSSRRVEDKRAVNGSNRRV